MTSYYRRFPTGTNAATQSFQRRPRNPEVISLPLTTITRKHATNRRLKSTVPIQSNNFKSFKIEAVGPSLVWDPLNNERSGLVCSCSVIDPTVEEDRNRERSNDRTVEINGKAVRRREKKIKIKDRTVEVVVAAAITVVFGVGNRVLYKLALVPLKHYPFFLAQLATIGYFSQSNSYFF